MLNAKFKTRKRHDAYSVYFVVFVLSKVFTHVCPCLRSNYQITRNLAEQKKKKIACKDSTTHL